MDFDWLDVITRARENKKDKSQRQENKKISKEIKRRNVSKSLGQPRNVY